MMTKLCSTAALTLALVAFAAPSQAQHRRGGSSSGGGGTAAPRGGSGGGGAVSSPRSGGGGRVIVGGGGYRPYYYGPRYSSFGFGFYSPYYYSPYYYPYGYSSFYGGGYPYGYPYYAPYAGYEVGVGGRAYGYGGVRIQDAPRDAAVYADGYYVGTVDDFDGTFQHLDLERGPHRIEIREEGQPATSFEVNIRPGENITYHAK